MERVPLNDITSFILFGGKNKHSLKLLRSGGFSWLTGGRCSLGIQFNITSFLSHSSSETFSCGEWKTSNSFIAISWQRYEKRERGDGPRGCADGGGFRSIERCRKSPGESWIRRLASSPTLIPQVFSYVSAPRRHVVGFVEYGTCIPVRTPMSISAPLPGVARWANNFPASKILVTKSGVTGSWNTKGTRCEYEFRLNGR